jgi:hypothetical protein
MSDTDGYFGPATPEPSGDSASIEQGIAELRQRRAIAEVSPPPPDDEPEAPQAPRVSDGKDGPLSVREASKIPGKAREQQWRLDQERRAAAYRAGLTDDPAAPPSADAGQRASDGTEQQQSPDPLAAERQAFEQQRAQLEQQRAHYEQEAQAAQWLTTLSATERELWVAEQNQAARVQAVAAEFNQRYADLAPYLGNSAALAQLQQNDPARHAQLVQDAAVLQAEAQQHQQAQQYRAQVTQQRTSAAETQFLRAAELHDAAFMADKPELQDPVKLSQMQHAARDYLAAKGLSKDEMAAHWSGRASFSLREKISQDILFDAVRWRMAQDRLQESRSSGRQLAPVLRPGMRSAGDSDSVYQAKERVERALARDHTGRAGVELGVRLMQANRALRSRG